MEMAPSLKELFQGTATVGERGQVVIPVQAREACGIQPGDKLLAFVHPAGSGVVFIKLEAMLQVSSLLSQLLAETENSAISDPQEETT